MEGDNIMIIIERNRNLLNTGYTLTNTRGKKNVLLFTILGMQFSSNKRRMFNYSLDDKGWVIYTNTNTLVTKLKMIFRGEIHLLVVRD